MSTISLEFKHTTNKNKLKTFMCDIHTSMEGDRYTMQIRNPKHNLPLPIEAQYVIENGKLKRIFKKAENRKRKQLLRSMHNHLTNMTIEDFRNFLSSSGSISKFNL